MRTFEEDVIAPIGLPPGIKPGKVLIPLHRPVAWYKAKAMQKGKTISTTKCQDVISLVTASKVFNNEIDENLLDLALNLDCIINHEAEYVKEQLRIQIWAEVSLYFPKIGYQVPEDYFSFNARTDLVIHVPKNYELQRGVFF